MKIVTASNGKKKVKMSKNEWQSIGKKAGWMSDQQNTEPLTLTEEDLARANNVFRAITERIQNGDKHSPQEDEYKFLSSAFGKKAKLVEDQINAWLREGRYFSV